MRRFLTIVMVCGLNLALGVPVWGIEAKPKSAAAQTQAPSADTSGAKRTTTHKTASTQVLLEKLKKDVREAKKSDSPQYDNYIDANNDGVDDRVKEKAKPAGVEPTPINSGVKPTSNESSQTKSKSKPASAAPTQPKSKAKPATTSTDTSRETTKKKKP